MNQLCRVCGEAAAGFHFGAFTCEGCKSFFGRTYNNAGSLGHCKNGGRCVITKKNRTSCKACRLTKCLAAGMSKSGSRYGRRSNWFKIHCLLQEKASATLSAASNVLSPGCKRSLHHLEDARVKDEDSGTDSPALSSPESQTSEGSLDDTRRTPFPLYPKLGVLSPFFLHPSTSPAYPRLPFYPYLYPVLSAAVSAAVEVSPPSTHSLTPRRRHPRIFSPSSVTTSPSLHRPPPLAPPRPPTPQPDDVETGESDLQNEPIDLSVRRPY
ncbi:hypothetical protein O3P69_011838 [Scylla paramamosain]|uniref:Nuclear receptor domain-containing protein n=1 Tax=Scylla paramamosain TaxID=85552 RepID=A0AAW0SGH2_SCYPA